MMSALIVAVLIVIGLLLIFVVFKKKKEGKAIEPNYQVFFSIGAVWIPVGVVFMIAVNPAIGTALISLGVAYVAIGLANRDKWKKKK